MRAIPFTWHVQENGPPGMESRLQPEDLRLLGWRRESRLKPGLHTWESPPHHVLRRSIWGLMGVNRGKWDLEFSEYTRANGRRVMRRTG
jgi:hypothetical protein